MRRFYCIFISLLMSVSLSAGCGEKEPSGNNGGNGNGNGGTDEPGKPIVVEPEEGKDLYGQITDTDGKPVPGVVVSDGTSSVVTDAKGIYQIKRASDAGFVYYTTPSAYEINVFGDDDSVAKFYEPIPQNAGKHRQDFVLKKRPRAVSTFNIMTVADPQVVNATQYARFKAESLPRLQSVASGMTVPTVMLVLGDINEDKVIYMDEMREDLGTVGVPVFPTPGNHDKLGGTSTTPRNADEYSSRWGPLNYSFCVGNVLFISMDNVRYTDSKSCAAGFTDEQVVWLSKQLSHFDSAMTVVMFYHMPMRDNNNIVNRKQVLDQLTRFNSIHLMSGHTHWQENVESTAPTRYEHIHAALGGAWWASTLNADGTPNGFSIYEVSGNTMKNWYHLPVKGARDHQIRLYRGNSSYVVKGTTYQYGYGEDVILANIWNADSKWTIKVYENNEYTGDMTRMTDNPIDKWTAAVNMGYYGRGAAAAAGCRHLYQYKLRYNNPTIKVVATDRFGQTYTATEITTDIAEGLFE